MKRDIDLIREILISIEKDDPNVAFFRYPKDVVEHHIFLLVDGGFLAGRPLQRFDSNIPLFEEILLTWKGHEFVNAARSEKRWELAKDLLAAGESGSFETLCLILGKLAEKEILTPID